MYSSKLLITFKYLVMFCRWTLSGGSQQRQRESPYPVFPSVGEAGWWEVCHHVSGFAKLLPSVEPYQGEPLCVYIHSLLM
jgi:hypothetical protein